MAGGPGRRAACPASSPDHADGALEVNPAGAGEGFGHGDVAQVGRGADARNVVRGEDLVDVPVSPVGGHDAEGGDNGAVVVAGGDDETGGRAARPWGHVPLPV